MSDIVERLNRSIDDGHGWCQADLEMLIAAIDEIEKLRAALRSVYSELMNLQPHIGQLDKHYQPFIDSHVDVAMEKIKEALGND